MLAKKCVFNPGVPDCSTCPLLQNCPQRKIDEFFQWNDPEDALKELLETILDTTSECPTIEKLPGRLFLYSQIQDLIRVTARLQSIRIARESLN